MSARLARLGAWLERQAWWSWLADRIDRYLLTPPWERRQRPLDAMKRAIARIAADGRTDDLPLLAELEWCIWAMGGDDRPAQPGPELRS